MGLFALRLSGNLKLLLQYNLEFLARNKMSTFKLRHRQLESSFSEKESSATAQKKCSGNPRNLEGWLAHALKVSEEFNCNGPLSGKKGRYFS